MNEISEKVRIWIEGAIKGDSGAISLLRTYISNLEKDRKRLDWIERNRPTIGILRAGHYEIWSGRGLLRKKVIVDGSYSYRNLIDLLMQRKP